jgi:hypothetical protein
VDGVERCSIAAGTLAAHYFLPAKFPLEQAANPENATSKYSQSVVQ